MFENVDKLKNTPKSQEVKDGVVTNKSVGRPKLPNMQAVSIRLDKDFHAKVKSYARKIGMGKSALITAALKSYMSQAQKKYRLLEEK